MSGSKRKKGASSDFKRVKAKVGKRAQRQNDTDVSFQSASLHLGQSIQGDNESQKSGNSNLISSRGRSLYDLLATASSHPAAAARCSSLKGILDIVKNHPPGALLPNLSALIPTSLHSCVDEDQDVRTSGIEILSVLLTQLQEKTINPFGALLIARVSSALHSLDASTRIDGVRLVKLVSTTCPSLTINAIDQLLPPFVGLLADQRTRKAIDDILQSLISLLRVTETKDPSISDSVRTNQRAKIYGKFLIRKKTECDHHPDMIYVAGGRSRNTVLRRGRSLHALPRRVESISHFSRLEHPELSSRSDGQGIKHKTSLMKKLRDSLIESINLESEPDRIASTSKIEPRGSMNYLRVNLLLRSIRYLHKNFIAMNAWYLDENENDFEKCTQQIVSVIMDVFPIDHNPSASNAARDTKMSCADEVNASIAITMLDLSHESPSNLKEGRNDNSKQWVKAIHSYVIPRIHHLQDTGNASSSSDLDITCKFLRRLGLDPFFSTDLISILAIIDELLFRIKDIQSARSRTARRISLIVMDLIDAKNFSLKDISNSPLSEIFISFLTTVPFYLEAWDVDFSYESRRIMEGISKLIREVEESNNLPVLESIRGDWHKLVADNGKSSSIFERYPWRLQKLWLGLVVLLRYPSDETLRNLASIGGRSMNQATSQSIVESIQEVRKTVPMQRYLTFLVQSVGVTDHVKKLSNVASSKNVFETVFFKADPNIERVARALTEPGSIQVLRMILPQICIWQRSTETKREKGGRSLEFLFKTRISHIILAYFFLMHSPKQTDQQLSDWRRSSIFVLANGMITVDTLTHSICTFVRCIVQSEEAIEFYSKLTCPIVAIMSSQHSVLSAVVRKITEWFQTVELTKIEQKNVLLLLVQWINDPQLQDAIKGSASSTSVKEQIHAIGCSQLVKDNEHAHEILSLLKTQQ